MLKVFLTQADKIELPIFLEVILRWADGKTSVEIPFTEFDFIDKKPMLDQKMDAVKLLTNRVNAILDTEVLDYEFFSYDRVAQELEYNFIPNGAKFHLKNANKLRELYENPAIPPSENHIKPTATNSISKPQIYFDKETGIGFTNGKRFKCKHTTDYYKVFLELYNSINTRLGRNKIIELLKLRPETDFTNKVNTYKIKEFAKELRIKTHLTKDTLVVSVGALTLVGERLKIPPNIT